MEQLEPTNEILSNCEDILINMLEKAKEIILNFSAQLEPNVQSVENEKNKIEKNEIQLKVEFVNKIQEMHENINILSKNLLKEIKELPEEYPVFKTRNSLEEFAIEENSKYIKKMTEDFKETIEKETANFFADKLE